MQEAIRCVMTNKALEDLEPDDFFVSLNIENNPNGSPRHYYSYFFLREWYSRRYNAGNSLVTLSTQVPLSAPLEGLGIIPVARIQTFEKVRYGMLAVLMACMIFIAFTTDSSCGQFSEKLSGFAKQKAAVLDAYNIDGDEGKFQQALDQINVLQRAFVNHCDEVLKSHSFERSFLKYQRVLYCAISLILLSADMMNCFFRKDPTKIMSDWLDSQTQRYNPPGQQAKDSEELGLRLRAR